MAYADIKSRLVTHAQTAAAACIPPIEDVQAGFPLPRSECVRVYYGGEADPARFERFTLGNELAGQVTLIALFLPLAALDEEMARAHDARGQAFAHALRTAVDADQDLATAGDNTTLEWCEPDIVTVGNTRFLTYVWRAVTDYVEYPLAK